MNHATETHIDRSIENPSIIIKDIIQYINDTKVELYAILFARYSE